jgi:hypothetical protein
MLKLRYFQRTTAQFQIKGAFIFEQIFHLKSESFSEALEFIRYSMSKTSMRRALGLNNFVKELSKLWKLLY